MVPASAAFCTECGQRVTAALPAPERFLETQPAPTEPPEPAPAQVPPPAAPNSAADPNLAPAAVQFSQGSSREPRRRPAPDWPVVPLRTRFVATTFNLGVHSCLAIFALAPTALLQRGALIDRPLVEVIAVSFGAVAVTQVAAILATTGRMPGIGRHLVRIGVHSYRGGQTAGFARSSLRSLLLVVLALPVGLALWSHLWHPTRRGWHERLSGSITTYDLTPLRTAVIPTIVAAIVATGCGIALWLTTAHL